jgi:hypothetical protein
MAKAKQRSEQHLIDEKGQLLLKSLLPQHWVLREYRPDYGLDYALEIFSPPSSGLKYITCETLGEHIFIQLKSVSTTETKLCQLFRRYNVEKQSEQLMRDEPVGALDTIRFSLETSELVTVERMGVGVPVLLVIADLTTSKCYFICLNDYIDKILIPKHDDYTTKGSRTIHIPIMNEIGNSFGEVALRWYAKRAKLYAAFQRFIFQEAELKYVIDTTEFISMARHFASRIENYDFWDDMEMWQIIGYYRNALKNLILHGRPNLINVDLKKLESDRDDLDDLEKYFFNDDVLALWQGLVLLARNYEDVCREWYLPTALGYECTYQEL